MGAKIATSNLLPDPSPTRLHGVQPRAWGRSIARCGFANKCHSVWAVCVLTSPRRSLTNQRKCWDLKRSSWMFHPSVESYRIPSSLSTGRWWVQNCRPCNAKKFLKLLRPKILRWRGYLDHPVPKLGTVERWHLRMCRTISFLAYMFLWPMLRSAPGVCLLRQMPNCCVIMNTLAKFQHYGSCPETPPASFPSD